MGCSNLKSPVAGNYYRNEQKGVSAAFLLPSFTKGSCDHTETCQHQIKHWQLGLHPLGSRAFRGHELALYKHQYIRDNVELPGLEPDFQPETERHITAAASQGKAVTES